MASNPTHVITDIGGISVLILFTLWILGLLATGFAGVSSAQSGFPQLCPDLHAANALPNITYQLMDRVNEERRKAGLTPVECELGLVQIAQSHSEWMADQRALSHYGQNKEGLFDRLRSRYPRFYGEVSENLFERWMGERENVSQQDMDRIVSGWMASAGHRANMLDPDKTHTGLAFARNGERLYVTQMFAKKQ